MIKQHLTAITALCIVLLSPGCNNDVFLDEPDLPEITEATIEGDGGEAEFVIPTNGLEHVSLDVFSDNRQFCTYYNTAGDVADSKIPASELGRIVYESFFHKLEIIKNGKKLTIRSICETAQSNETWTLRLEYTYGVRFIDFTVLPGRPLSLSSITYTSRLDVNDNAQVKTRRVGCMNNSPHVLKTEEYPYLQADATTIVNVSKSNAWVESERVVMKVPAYENGEWVAAEKTIQPGRTYRTYRPDQLMKIEIDIPAYFDGTIITDVTYSRAEITGTMLFTNEILDLQRSVEFTATSLYPVSYELRIQNNK